MKWCCGEEVKEDKKQEQRQGQRQRLVALGAGSEQDLADYVMCLIGFNGELDAPNNDKIFNLMGFVLWTPPKTQIQTSRT